MDHTRDADFLGRLALTAAQTLDPRALVNLVITETTVVMGVDVCSVYLRDTDGGDLVLAATNGLAQEGVGRVRLAVGEGLTGHAARERTAVVVADVREDARFRWLDGVDQERFVSMCSVPIVSADRLVGVLNVQTDAPHAFDDGEVALLQAIAAHVAGALERSALQERLQRQVHELRRSHEIHRRFTRLSLSGAGLRAICSEIADQASGPVGVYDDAGERIASSHDGLLPVRLGDAERADALPVRAGDEVLGHLVVMNADPARQADGSQRRALEHGATVLALELARERAAAEAERHLRGDLVEELLASPLQPADAARLADRAARLGQRLAAKTWVMVMDPDDATARAALGSPAGSSRVARALAAAGEAEGAALTVVQRAGGVVVLVADEDDPARVERLATRLVEAAGDASRGGAFSGGVSGDAGPPHALHALAQQARLAHRSGRRMGRSGGVHMYHRMGAERLLMAVEPREELDAFVDEWLGALVAHDVRGPGSAPLLETLDAMSDTGWSPRAAARALNVHVNTLLYRLQRAREVSGRDLGDADVRLAMGLALKARRMRTAESAADHRQAS